MVAYSTSRIVHLQFAIQLPHFQLELVQSSTPKKKPENGAKFIEQIKKEHLRFHKHRNYVNCRSCISAFTVIFLWPNRRFMVIQMAVMVHIVRFKLSEFPRNRTVEQNYKSRFLCWNWINRFEVISSGTQKVNRLLNANVK